MQVTGQANGCLLRVIAWAALMTGLGRNTTWASPQGTSASPFPTPKAVSPPPARFADLESPVLGLSLVVGSPPPRHPSQHRRMLAVADQWQGLAGLCPLGELSKGWRMAGSPRCMKLSSVTLQVSSPLESVLTVVEVDAACFRGRGARCEPPLRRP